MTSSTAYTIAYGSTVVAASLAATLMAGSAMAEGPIVVEPSKPFVSSRSRAEVQAEVMNAREAVSAAGREYALQQNPIQPGMNGPTRAQVTAEYLAARDEVRARNGEDSGSGYAALQAQPEQAGTMLTRSASR